MQLVGFPSHIHGNTLDLVLSNQSENIITLEPIRNLSTSDHSIILVETIFNSRFNSNKDLILDWSNGDKDGLFNYLNDVQWSTELSQLSTEKLWKFFKDQLGFSCKYRKIHTKNTA